MKQFFFCSGLLLFLSIVVFRLDSFASSDKINWNLYEEGMVIGKKTSQKILLYFYANWCGYCNKMKKKTFQDSLVIDYVNTHFVPIKVNTDKKEQLALKYRVRGLPSTFILSEDGDEISNLPGYIKPSKMLLILKFINTESYTKMSFEKFVGGKK